ncbi:hypothetical protein NKI61_10770 [Mesorhizobium sp. M0514]|uniref:hypothetical protein n=1 Tax=unclassified Mesorhizobium TaxID=325217 RepID=UPI0012DE1E31|nr:hypothetical protein [Mesorhizobium sp. L2C085B000]
MNREEWKRSGQGKKTQRRRCGKTIETERSEGGLRSDPNPFEDAVGVAWKEYAEGTPQWLRSVTAIVARAAALLYFGQRCFLARHGGVGPTPSVKKRRPISLIFGLNRRRVRGGSEGDQLIAEGSGFQAAKCRDDFLSHVDSMQV